METLSLSFSAALLMGLAFGAGPCNLTCMPYLGPVFLRQTNREGADWQTILPFSLGRLSSYALLGTIAGGFGYAATTWIENGLAAKVLGVATIIIGVLMLRKTAVGKACHADGRVAEEETVIRFAPGRQRPLFSLSLFGMGAGMALNPCVPLATVLTVSATMATPADGFMLGLAFGLGAVAIPTLLFGVAVAHFGTQIRYHLSQWGGRIEQVAGGLLVLLGGLTVTGFVQI